MSLKKVSCRIEGSVVLRAALILAALILAALTLAPLALATPALAATPSRLLAEVSAAPGMVAGVPAWTESAVHVGPLDAATPLKVTVWLQLHNKAAFDQRVNELYTPGSPEYHKWLTLRDLLSYAPNESEIETVKRELEKGGLSVMVDDADPFAVRASGTAAQMEDLFSTAIDNFQVQEQSPTGKLTGAVRTFHANVSEARLSGVAAPLVLAVSGLDNVEMKPMALPATDPKTGAPFVPVPLAGMKASTSGLQLSTWFTNKCFTKPAAYTFGIQGQLPYGVYYGNDYNQGDLQCAYSVTQMRAVYGLNAVYAANLQGAGQTIVIVDPYGSSTILSDANNFSTMNGLDSLTSDTLQMVYPSGPPADPMLGEEWVGETSLDVEWAHAIAPKARIVLLAAASGDDQDLQMAIHYATLHRMGSVISNSYSSPEAEHTPSTLAAYNQLIEQAAATGIAVNYASGDDGDYRFGTPVGAVAAPADSPYATAVGGTSIGVPGGTGPAQEVGWGTNESFLAYDRQIVLDPPQNAGFVGGSGGGSSLVYPKPAWQKDLPGNYRKVPDVAMDADPLTGVVLVYTDPANGPVIGAMGGTSLACPMFSAMWSLANEKAGHWLGQAAPILSRLPPQAMNDVLPSSSPTNVAGTVVDSNGATFYSAAELAAPLENADQFVSAFWPIGGEFLELTFGTDSSLTTAKGWDNVTGYGTPLGLAFIEAAAKQ